MCMLVEQFHVLCLQIDHPFKHDSQIVYVSPQ
jgi:hypothetical protein